MKDRESLGRMLGCLHRHARMYFHREFSAMGLGSGTHHFLIYLHHHDGCTQQELSHGLHMDKANSTRAIKKLIALGFVSRIKDEHDQRAFRVFLTESGKRSLPRIKRVLENWTDILALDMNSEERDQAMRLLRRMSANAVAHIHHRSESRIRA
jgi:DNA-binding MarR family transcriptional regulator